MVWTNIYMACSKASFLCLNQKKKAIHFLSIKSCITNQ